MITSIENLSSFLHSYHKLWGEDFSLDIGNVEVNIPAVLQIFYSKIGGLTLVKDKLANGNRTPLSAQDYIASPNEVKSIGGEVEFIWENQGNFSVRTSSDGEDPVVYSNWLYVVGESDLEYSIVCDTLSHFLITFSLQEAVMSSKYLSTIGVSSVTQINIALEDLWLNGFYVCGEPTHNFYYSVELECIIMKLDKEIWIGSNSNRIDNFLDSSLNVNRIH